MIQTKTLRGGVTLVTEKLDHLKSAAFGIWVAAGSRNEPPEFSGACHALEHMAFKGTTSRTSREIAEFTDARGIQLNAYTTKECTCFFGRALETRLSDALDIISDIYFNPLISEDDWRVERGVILEELDMYEDSPEDLVYERIFSEVYGSHTLARPIIGSRETLNAFTSAGLLGFRKDNYRRFTAAVLAGAFSPEHAALLEEKFAYPCAANVTDGEPPRYEPALCVKEKDIEQNHVVLAFDCVPAADPDRYVSQILTGALGGGMSSRLFQTVREREGLCYDVNAHAQPYADCGLFTVYMGVNRDNELKALETALDVLREFKREGVTGPELERVRENLKAGAVMGLESAQNRIQHYGGAVLTLGEVPSTEELLAGIDAVTRDDVKRLAEKILDFSRVSLSAVGKVKNPEDYALWKR